MPDHQTLTAREREILLHAGIRVEEATAAMLQAARQAADLKQADGAPAHPSYAVHHFKKLMQL